MDERLLSLIFLLMAAVLPLRGLSERWAGRPERRGAVRALWAAYLLTAAVAVGALVLGYPRDNAAEPPAFGGPEQLAGCVEGAARA